LNDNIRARASSKRLRATVPLLLTVGVLLLLLADGDATNSSCTST